MACRALSAPGQAAQIAQVGWVGAAGEPYGSPVVFGALARPIPVGGNKSADGERSDSPSAGLIRTAVGLCPDGAATSVSALAGLCAAKRSAARSSRPDRPARQARSLAACDGFVIQPPPASRPFPHQTAHPTGAGTSGSRRRPTGRCTSAPGRDRRWPGPARCPSSGSGH